MDKVIEGIAPLLTEELSINSDIIESDTALAPEESSDAVASALDSEANEVQISLQEELVDLGSEDTALVFEDSSEGIDITGVNRWAPLGQELGISANTTGFIFNARNASAVIGDQTVFANYATLQLNKSDISSTSLLSTTALETTLQLASVGLNVATIVATSGDDRFLGYDQDVAVYGGAGDDYFRSTGGDKQLFGEEGSDSFAISGGNGAFIDGGDGYDRATFGGGQEGLVIESVGAYGQLGQELDINPTDNSYAVYQRGATADFNGETVAAGYVPINNNNAVGSDAPLSGTALETALTFGHLTKDVEEITGSKYDDVFLGGRYDEAFNGGDGDDWLEGRTGNDTLNGGAGNDNIVLSEGIKDIDGGAGNDTIWLRGRAEDFTVLAQEDGSYTITTATGETSTVRGVEFARLSNSDVIALADLVVAEDPLPEPELPPEIITSDDTGAVEEDGTVVLDLLENDSGEALAILSISAPQNGSAVLNADGTVTYTPSADFNGTDSFSYTVTDAAGQTSTANVSVTVLQVNDAPVVTGTAVTSVLETAGSDQVLAQVTAEDVDGDALQYEISGGNDAGLFEIDAAGAISLAEGASLDFETTSLHELEVSVFDAEATTTTQVSINVEDVDETRSDLIAQTDRAFGVTDGSGSIGLTGAADYTSHLPFLNLMKFARPHYASRPNEFGYYNRGQLEEMGLLDENDYLTALPEDASHGGFIFSGTVGREGTYVLRWEGEGDVGLHLDAEIVSQSDNEIVFTHNSGTVEIRIFDTDPNGTGDYVRDISLVKEEYVDLYDAGAVFNPEAISRLQDFREFRTMNWQRTIESPIETLDDIPKLEDSSWATEYGVPMEALVQLANEAGTDLWFTIPTKANAEVVEYYATYIRDNLDPNLKVTVEYGNELWNYGYRDTYDLRDEAVETWGIDPGDNAARYAFVAKKATEAALIFEETFNQVDEADRPLLHKTLGTQTAVLSVTENLLAAEAWEFYEPDTFIPPAEVFDSIAVTTYFGGQTLTNDGLRDALLEAIADPEVDAHEFLFNNLMDPTYPSSIPALSNLLHAQRDIADRYGIGVTDYEGGAHLLHFDNTDLPAEVAESLVDFYVEFYRTDYMRELYQAVWDIWRDVGDGAFTNFGSISEPSRYGFFSFLSDIFDTSPRAEFLYEQNELVPAWWEDRGGEHFQQGIFETGSDADDLLIGTNQEDQLGGGAGNDYIVAGFGDDAVHGGEGFDTILLAGAREDYDIYRDGDAVIFRHANGTDRVLGVEQVEFQNGEDFTIEELVKSYDAENTGPVAVDDLIDVNEDENTDITALLLNDIDADGDTLVVADVSQPQHGSVRLAADGTVTYIPDPNFVGEDSFTYVISDGTARSTATASITVHNQVDAPTIKSDIITVLDTDYALGDVIYQVEAEDLDGDALEYSIVGGDSGNRFEIDATTGEIRTAGALTDDVGVPVTEYDLQIEVTDGDFVVGGTVSLEVHQDANVVAETAPVGQLFNGGLGDNDVLQLVGHNGQGRNVGPIGNGTYDPHYTGLLNEGLFEGLGLTVFRNYTKGYEVEIDGEIVVVDQDTLDSDSFEFVLQQSNYSTGFEVLSGTEFADSLGGSNNEDDRYYGNGGNDFIATRGGDDILVGGAGRDYLIGGQGADTFVFDDLGREDFVQDFTLEDGDVLDVSALLNGFNSNSTLGDFLELEFDETFGQQILNVSAEGDGNFVEIIRFSAETALFTLDELQAENALLLV